MRVAVLGASPHPERYSNRAVRLLQSHGHEVIPVNPGHARIEGLPVFKHLADLPPGSVDTVTVYVQPALSSTLGGALVALAPSRVIFNPGAENAELAARLKESGIDAVEACTLVMLRTGQF